MRLLLVALIVGGSAAFVPLGAIRCCGRGFAGAAFHCGLSHTTVVGHTPLPLHAARARLPLHAARARPRMLFNTPSRLGADIVLAIANWFGQWSIRMAPRALADAVLSTGKWLTITYAASLFISVVAGIRLWLRDEDERKRNRALEERNLAFDEEERKRKLALEERKLALEERKLAFDEEERKRKFAFDEEERERKLAQPFTRKLWG
ncbi:hypothetical protein KFE25_006341 [Diacronema lutheri]|uniref:Uncharacterized protein n=1 Tax=Diacronema lutheri TaxID=2081491 RepID=A0A8J5XIU0_DIALT|nr:hypothetical protein KFE25_006341 [Diacronema lutheri]